MNIGFNGLSNVELIFPMERPVFLREVNNDMYSVTAYFWAKIFSELPMSVLIPILQSSLTYFAIGFSQVYWYKFPIFCAISVLIYNAFTGLGYILGTAISNPQVAAALNPILVVPTMLFAGFFVDQGNIPYILYPLKETAIFKYGFQAYMMNEFTDLDIECMRETEQKKFCDPLGNFTTPQGLQWSIYILIIIWVVTYFISLLIMKSLSRKHE